jgi:hypothetical protein
VQDQQQNADDNSTRERMHAEPLYSRPMPGGGYVRVELLAREPDMVNGEPLRGRVIMERRAPIPAAAEVEEHLVVEELEGDDPNVVVAELFRIARDNAAIARRVLRRQKPSVRAD